LLLDVAKPRLARSAGRCGSLVARLLEADPSQYLAQSQYWAEAAGRSGHRSCLRFVPEAWRPIDALLRVGRGRTGKPAWKLCWKPPGFDQDSRLLFRLSNLLRHAPEAIALLQRVTELEPQNYLAWNNLSSLLEQGPEGRATPQTIDRVDEAGRRAVAAGHESHVADVSSGPETAALGKR
jgi:hypothetical protein